MSFGDYLEIDLTLTIGGTAHVIPGGNVKLLELTLASYGFSGVIELVLADDSTHGGGETDGLLADFQTANLIEVAVSVATVFPAPEAASTLTPVSVAGIATQRSVEEGMHMTAQDRAVLWRRYRIEFTDPARVLWGQHFPCALYTATTLTAVIDDHKGSKITITYDGDAWSAAQPLVFLNLVPEAGASFYDFVVWYTDAYAAVFAYDYTAAGYTLRAAKDATGTAVELFGDDVSRLRVVFPEVPRYKANVLNSYAAAQTSTAVDNAQGIDTIRHDFLMRSAIAQDATDRVTVETSRLITRLSELRIEMRRWPSVDFPPGALISFNAGNLWPSNGLQVGTTWRVRRHEIRARSQRQGPDADHDEPKAMFDVEVRAELEQQGETWVERPAYVRPTWPGYVEGTVVSAQGEDDELTYQYYENADTSLNEYNVTVPVFAAQVVTAPYDPHQGSGKMYMPIHKTERVLLAIDFLKASIARQLDWRDGALAAMDAQGERIFFGKKSGAATMVDHSYDDSKPVFSITRTNDTDTGTITISEGSLVIQVKESS